ncbi:MAG: hypothetical protein ABIH70_07815 [Chloroflexota bacterium]
MESTVDHKRDGIGLKAGSEVNEYRESVRKLIDTEVRNILDEETRKATRELIEEQRKAIRQIVDEHKLVIKEVV